MSERKYTKCECCPSYVRKYNDTTKKYEWKCDECRCFDGYTLEERMKVIETWINANKESDKVLDEEIEVEDNDQNNI